MANAPAAISQGRMEETKRGFGLAAISVVMWRLKVAPAFVRLARLVSRGRAVRAHRDIAPGPRAVPGSQQPRWREDVRAYSTMLVQPHALRAEDGSRSGGPLAALSRALDRFMARANP